MGIWNTSDKNKQANDAARRERLTELTATAKLGMVAFAETGKALEAIQAEELWRLEAATWSDWCSTTMGITDRRASQLIEAAKTCSTLKESGLAMPSSERVARELAGLNPFEAVEAWQEATDNAGGQEPTAELVAKAAKKRRPKKAKRSAVAKPSNFRVPGAAVRVVPRKSGFTGYVAALEHALQLARQAEADDASSLKVA